MTIQTEIEEMEQRLAALKARQSRCQHDWGPIKYTPYEGRESYFTGCYETHGVHMNPIMNSKPVTKDRWTRTCKKCGLPQHTQQQREVKVEKKFEPDF